MAQQTESRSPTSVASPPRSPSGQATVPMRTNRHTPPSGRTILLVDDQPEMLASLRSLLEGDGHRVLTAGDGAQALACLGAESVQVVVVDWTLPATTGDELVARIREGAPLVQIILQARPGEAASARELLRELPVHGYHDASDDPQRLLLAIDVACKAHDRIADLHVAERLKTELLANVSHEFRSPLNVIVGYLDLLGEGTFGDCPPEAGRVVERVRGNAAYLLELVEDFLDLSRLEAGAAHVRCAPVELAPLLRELGEGFSLLVGTKGVAFRSDVPSVLPSVEADGAKLRVVLQNLLANAAKFTERGQVSLRAWTGGDARQVTIEVSDTGPGIPADQQEAIFDPFHQLEPGDRRGAGLGLALARRFTRVMHGDLTVRSTLGEGSTFTVQLPAAGAPPTSCASGVAA